MHSRHQTLSALAATIRKAAAITSPLQLDVVATTIADAIVYQGLVNRWDDIVQEVRIQEMEHQGKTPALLVSARPLSENLRSLVAHRAGALLKKDLECSSHIKKDLIGGVRVVTRDCILFASITDALHIP